MLVESELIRYLLEGFSQHIHGRSAFTLNEFLVAHESGEPGRGCAECPNRAGQLIGIRRLPREIEEPAGDHAQHGDLVGEIIL